MHFNEPQKNVGDLDTLLEPDEDDLDSGASSVRRQAGNPPAQDLEPPRDLAST